MRLGANTLSFRWLYATPASLSKAPTPSSSPSSLILGAAGEWMDKTHSPSQKEGTPSSNSREPRPSKLWFYNSQASAMSRQKRAYLCPIFLTGALEFRSQQVIDPLLLSLLPSCFHVGQRPVQLRDVGSLDLCVSNSVKGSTSISNEHTACLVSEESSRSPKIFSNPNSSPGLLLSPWTPLKYLARVQSFHTLMG